MLRISKKADYAVFLLGCIARQGAYPGGAAPDSVVSAQEIARQAGLNKSVVANLLKEFTRQGLLESVRGLKGGYRLVRDPKHIDLAEILQVVEGPFTLVDCLKHRLATAAEPALAGATLLPGFDDHNCSLTSFCPTKNPMRIVHERIAQLFSDIKLDELCGLPATSAAVRFPPAGAVR